MGDFSNSLMNQVGLLKGEKELINAFVECYMTMLLEKRKIEMLKIEIDHALEHRNKQKFVQLTNHLFEVEKEMLDFE
nr:IDEAL domain-containing protein [Listeria sp. PSOL-1]